MGKADKRESFSSRLGFILLSAGCAIGLGNVWRFPTTVGKNVVLFLFIAGYADLF